MAGDECRKKIKTDIVKFIETRWFKNKEALLSNIQAIFQKPPHSISDGTIRNILDELVAEKKISTWKKGKNRYYGPPKLSISLKFGAIFALVTIAVAVTIDIIFNKYVGLFLFIAYSLILVTIFTAFSYTIERKLYN